MAFPKDRTTRSKFFRQLRNWRLLPNIMFEHHVRRPSSHSIVKLDLPLQPPRQLTFCVSCRRVNFGKGAMMKKHQCSNMAVWSTSRLRVLKLIDKAAKKAKGKRLTALSELSDVLTGRRSRQRLNDEPAGGANSRTAGSCKGFCFDHSNA